MNQNRNINRIGSFFDLYKGIKGSRPMGQPEYHGLSKALLKELLRSLGIAYVLTSSSAV
jgi:hypothetical protein